MDELEIVTKLFQQYLVQLFLLISYGKWATFSNQKP